MLSIPGTTKVYAIGLYNNTLKKSNTLMGALHLSMKVSEEENVLAAVEDPESLSRVLSLNNLSVNMDSKNKS